MSRKLILGSLMAALMLVMVASVAYAARVQCFRSPIATCYGTEEADTIYGSDDPDLIHGLGGDDYIFTNAGQDTVFGNTGNDDIYGEAGSDTLRGNRGNDRLRDREGNNDVDQLFGGRDNDILASRDYDNRDTLDCGLGVDTVLNADEGDTIAENCENLPE